MDQNKILNLKKIISDSNNILVVLPAYIDTDVIAAAATYFHFITRVLRKKAMIAASTQIPQRFAHILSAYNIEEKAIISEIKPLQYVINIKDTEKDLELAVNRSEHEVEIVMIPKLSEIDLSKISMSSNGMRFDLFITFNVRNLSDLGSIYTNSVSVFDKIKSIAINSNFVSSFGMDSIFADNVSTVSEVVFAVLEGFGADIDNVISNVLFEGIVAGTDGLHKVKSTSAIKTALKLSDENTLSQKFKNLFYGYSPEGLELRKKIFKNMSQKDGVASSYLSINDLNDLGIVGTQLDGMDYLPFNIVDNISLYVFGYSYINANKFLIETQNQDEIAERLKSLQYTVSRSANLICIITDKNIEQVVSDVTGKSMQTNMFDTTQPFTAATQNTSTDKINLPRY